MRNRSMALVVRDQKILIEKVVYENRFFYTIPGGGIEAGETPEEAALRELKEECGVDGDIRKKLTMLYKANGSAEHVFEVVIPEGQEPVKGYDPEEPADAQPIKSVCWMSLNELPERDRAFMWTYGLLGVEGFFEEIVGWGDEISYPGKGL